MTQQDEHDQVIKEYTDFVESIEKIDGKLHITTLEKQTLKTQFTSSGWIVEDEDKLYEAIESLLMEKSAKFGELFHTKLLNKLDALSGKE